MRPGTAMILHNDGALLPTLGLDRATKDALATYARQRWPQGTAKAVAREWDLTTDEAKNIIAGRASVAALDRIWKHPRGGWAILIPVMGAVIGEPVDAFIDKERHRHEQQAARLGALARSFRAGADRDRPDRAGVGAGSVRRTADQGRRVGAAGTQEADR